MSIFIFSVVIPMRFRSIQRESFYKDVRSFSQRASRNPYEIQVNTKSEQLERLNAQLDKLSRNPYEIQVNTKMSLFGSAVWHTHGTS